MISIIVFVGKVTEIRETKVREGSESSATDRGTKTMGFGKGKKHFTAREQYFLSILYTRASFMLFLLVVNTV